MSYLFIKNQFQREKSVLFSQKLKIQKKPKKNIFSGFLGVFLGGFFYCQPCLVQSQQLHTVARLGGGWEASCRLTQPNERRLGAGQPGKQVGDELRLREILRQVLGGGLLPVAGHDGLVHALEQVVELFDVADEGLLVEILVAAPGRKGRMATSREKKSIVCGSGYGPGRIRIILPNFSQKPVEMLNPDLY
jgi:hypothetical protein